MPRRISPRNWPKIFYMVGTAAGVTALLYWMQSLLLPIVLAILFTFVLAPAVTFLERRIGGRPVAVGAVVSLVLATTIGVGWMLFSQFSSMVDQLPRYERKLTEKVSSYYLTEGVFDKLNYTLARMQGTIAKQERIQEAKAGVPTEARVQTVRIAPEKEVLNFKTVSAAVKPLLEPLAEFALAWVLVVFFLMRREDMRDRVMSLVGVHHLATTTRALDEAGARISAYLLRQALLNLGVSVVVGFGLFFMGVPYAAMFGVLAGLLRYIPDLGPWLAALLPLTMIAIVSDGWSLFFMAAGFLIAVELLVNMIIEPRLYGAGIGLTETATALMVSFWAWLWGPLGLLVGMPLSATLSVFARYVPGLHAFNTLFSSEPAMDAHLSVYQRMLAGRTDEALDLLEPGTEGEDGVLPAFDDMLIPAVARAQADYQVGILNRTEMADFNDVTRTLIDELAGMQMGLSEAMSVTVLGYPGRGEVNQLALVMLGHVLASKGVKLEILDRPDLVSDTVASLVERRPALVLISSFAPGHASHARLLCQRLRAALPELYLVVGRWVPTEQDESVRALLRSAGANAIVSSLREAQEAILARVVPLQEAGTQASSPPHVPQPYPQTMLPASAS